MRFRKLVEELLNRYSEDFLDEIAGKISFVVKEEEERIVWYRAGMCYQKKIEEINAEGPCAEKKFKIYEEVLEECIKEAKRSVLKKK